MTGRGDSAPPAAVGDRLRLPTTRVKPPYLAMALLGLLVAAAVFGPWLAPVNPRLNDLGRALEPPVFLGGSWDRPLGTDALGRDLLSRILVGARSSVLLSAGSVVIAALIGTAVGVVAGWSRHPWVDAVLMRLADITFAFPVILLGLIIAVQRGADYLNVIIVLVLLLWARFARLVRGQVRSIRELDYIQLARVCGGGTWWILRRHVLPNILDAVVILMTLQLGWAVLAEASLSFLGAGVPPPQPAWGSMVAAGRDVLRSAWWVSTLPGLAIVAAVLGFNLVGDWLRDRLDPRLDERQYR